MTRDTARAATSQRTKAILAVHLYSSLAPMRELVALGHELAVPVVEDASQAHGALIDGVRAGAAGTIGVFSMQQSKLLTAGEGGVCVTSDAKLYRRLAQLRADSRMYVDETYGAAEEAGLGRALVPCGEVFGRNLCMSEFHAAILVERLPLLDKENIHRHRNFINLAGRLKSIYGVTLPTGTSSELPTHYRVCMRFMPEVLAEVNIGTIARCLEAELNLPVEVIDTPLNRCRLYQPMLSPLASRQAGASSIFDPVRFPLPQATAAAAHSLTLPHWCLLGDDSDIDDIVVAIEKVLRHIPQLPMEIKRCAST
jgi:dTDP-4-amino-4,6-dideoxygalactose transaminase